MSMDHEEEEALVEELLDAEYYATHPCECSDLRCGGCGIDFDGGVEDERAPRWEGLCLACWGLTQHWRRRPDWERMPRTVVLGEWCHAVFEFWPERTLWIYDLASEPMKLEFFDPEGMTDARLAKKLKTRITFS
jgi:hypothetical protein